MNVQYYILSPHNLIPTEEVDYERVLEVEKEILNSGHWKVPIAIHIDIGFVMDGHHRLTVAKRLNLKGVPVVFRDYNEVHVNAWRSGEIITPNDILDMVKKNEKFPYKTTRHIFKKPIPVCNIPLYNLKDLNFIRSFII